MAKRENILPYSTIGVLINEATGKRVTNSAKITAEKILGEVTKKIVYKANLLAEHNGRKTIKAKDINLAFMQIKEDI